jgi:hypothetical protein
MLGLARSSSAGCAQAAARDSVSGHTRRVENKIVSVAKRVASGAETVPPGPGVSRCAPPALSARAPMS